MAHCRCCDSDTPTQPAGQGKRGQGNAESLGGEAESVLNRPSAYFHEGQTRFPGKLHLRTQSVLKQRAIDSVGRDRRFAGDQSLERSAVRMFEKSGTPRHLAVGVHRKDVPASAIGFDDMPAVCLKLVAMDRAIVQVDGTSHPLHGAEHGVVASRVYLGFPKSLGQVAGVGRQHNQMVPLFGSSQIVEEIHG
jgi:hypothetical protein